MSDPIQGQIVRVANWSGTVADPTGGFRDDTDTLIDPTSITLTVEYADGTSQTFSADQLSKDGVGLYHLDLDTSAHAGTWVVAWSSTGPQTYQPFYLEVEPKPQPPGPTVPPLVTMEQLAAYLELPVGSMNTARAQMMIDGASAAIRQFTNQTLSLVVDDVVTMDPSGGRFLWLDQLPVVSVSSVVVEGRTLDPSEYRVDGETGRLARRGWHRWWGKPGGIVVTYTHGYATVPPDLVSVCLGMAERGYMSEPGDYAITGETIGGDYSYQRSWQVAATGVAGLTSAEQATLLNYQVEPQHPDVPEEWFW